MRPARRRRSHGAMRRWHARSLNCTPARRLIDASCAAGRAPPPARESAMSLIHWLIDFVLHLDRHLSELLAHYHAWIYVILFLILFAQTGIVLAAILPGDSLLFGAGALAAVDQSGTLQVPVLLVLLSAAVLCGNSVNYLVGHALGERVAAGHFKLIRRS